MPFSQSYSATAWGACASLAEHYGFTSPARFFASLGVTAPRSWTGYTSEHTDFLMQHTEIRDLVKNTGMFDHIDYENTYSKQCHSQVLKVCKHCLKEGIVHSLEWQLPHKTFCEKHSVLLEESCQHMYVDPTWSKGLKCKACIPELPAKIKTPEYIICASKFNDEDKGLYFESLMEMSEWLIRPFDMIPAEIRWNKVSPQEVHQLFTDAHTLLSQPHAYLVWQEMILKHRRGLDTLGEAATHHNLLQLRQLFSCSKEFPFQQVNPSVIQQILTHYHERSLPLASLVAIKRLKLVADNDDVSFQVTGLDVARFLGIHSLAVTRMLSAGILRAILPGLQTDKQIFDIREILKVMSRTFKESKVKAELFVDIADIPQPIYDLYNIDAEFLVSKALSGEVNSQLHINSTLQYKNQLNVSVNGIKEILKSAWENMPSQNNSVVAKMLRTSQSVITALIEDGYLRVEKNDNAVLISADSIREFVGQFLLINRKATFSHSRNTAQKVTNCCGVEPVFHKYIGRKSTHFIAFRKSDLNPCCLQHVPKRFEHFVSDKVDLSKRTRKFSNQH